MFQQNAIALEPEIRALPLPLENPELDFQGLICPSIKAALVSLCSWFISLRLLGLKKALLEGSFAEQLFVAPIILAGNLNQR